MSDQFTGGYETTAAIKTLLVKDFDLTALTSADISKQDLVDYLNKFFHRDVVGKMIYETFFHSNATISDAFDDIATYIDTLVAAGSLNLPIGGTFNSPTGNVMFRYLEGVKHARGRHHSTKDDGIVKGSGN